MNKTRTLKQCVSEISVKAFICTAVLMFTSFTLYSIKKTKVTEEKIQSDLTLNLKNQVNSFLPSFLLPEQKMGMDLLIERIKSDEALDDIRIIKSQADMPQSFSSCQISRNASVTCASNDMSTTAIIAPLTEMNEHYGYILKSKKNTSAASLVGVMQFAGITLLILAAMFIVIYTYVTRLVSKTLPTSLDHLVRWVEAEIEGKSIKNMPLVFKEIEDLKVKIAEVIERANKSRDQAVIGQVTSGIMHDIKTPLQSIVTAAHLVSEKEINSPKRIARLENLFNMCANNLPLIGEIIETTLDGNRNIQITKSNGNLRETIEASLQVTSEFSRLRNVVIEVDAPKELIVNYDSLQFTRVLNNLLKNGIEAASEKTTEFPKVRVSVKAHDSSFVKVIVEDSGVGFSGSPEKVFRAFGTTKSRGTGLGLMISKKIIEAHRGKISASNTSIYGGAKMEVLLPFEAQL